MGRITVTLNGTNYNSWHRYGLNQNPFPQIARAESGAGDRALASLNGDPIPDTDHIRRVLAGKVSEELVDLCCARFVKGERVRFIVKWEND